MSAEATATTTQLSSQAPVTTSATTSETVTSSQGAAGANGGTVAPTTHTAPEPAFTEGESTAQGLSGATAVVRAHGYTASDPGEYHEDQALRVLVGSRTGDQEQAFFFINGRYIGTDAKEPSGDIQVLSQSDTEVILGYGLYRRGDALCCPGGGLKRVRFQLNDGLLTTLDPIPPVNSSTGLSRQ